MNEKTNKMRWIKGRNLLIVLFLISVCVRIPNLNRPLSKHHEFNAALILIPMEVWESTSASAHNFSAVTNYPGEANKGINNLSLDYLNKDGNYYYMSFPTATYVLPYVVFKTFGMPISPLSLQLFALMLQLVAILLLYEIILLSAVNRDGKEQEMIGVIAGAIFLFSPSLLWFFSNGYTHHTLVIVFTLWAVYSFLKIYTERAHSPVLTYVRLFIAVFSAVSTEWGGLLLAVILVCFSLFLWKKKKVLRWVLPAAILSSAAGIVVMYFQYGALVGGDQVLQSLQERFWYRSNAGKGTSGFFPLLTSLGKWYMIGYLPVLLVIIGGCILLRFKNLELSKAEKVTLFIFLGVALLHHLLMGGFTIAHNYSVLIDGLFLSCLGAFIAIRLEVFKKPLWTWVLAIGFIMANTAQYYYINPPGEISRSGEPYNWMQEMGETIAANTSSDEVVFIKGLEENPAPQIVYYAKRNYYRIKSDDEAQFLLKERGASNGVIFEVENNCVKSVLKTKILR